MLIKPTTHAYLVNVELLTVNEKDMIRTQE